MGTTTTMLSYSIVKDQNLGAQNESGGSERQVKLRSYQVGLLLAKRFTKREYSSIVSSDSDFSRVLDRTLSC